MHRSLPLVYWLTTSLRLAEPSLALFAPRWAPFLHCSRPSSTSIARHLHHLHVLDFHRHFSSSDRIAAATINRQPTKIMGEFSDDDDFASFDLEGAIASARKASPATKQMNQPSPSMAKENQPNIASTASSFGQAKRPAFSPGDSNKKLKSDGSDGGEDALMNTDDVAIIPEEFKEAMTGALQSHFGHSTFRPGQLAVLHSLLGDEVNGGKDTCVFWATG